jgi:hypothetical protein
LTSFVVVAGGGKPGLHARRIGLFIAQASGFFLLFSQVP